MNIKTELKKLSDEWKLKNPVKVDDEDIFAEAEQQIEIAVQQYMRNIGILKPEEHMYNLDLNDSMTEKIHYLLEQAKTYKNEEIKE